MSEVTTIRVTATALDAVITENAAPHRIVEIYNDAFDQSHAQIDKHRVADSLYQWRKQAWGERSIDGFSLPVLGLLAYWLERFQGSCVPNAEKVAHRSSRPRVQDTY